MFKIVPYACLRKNLFFLSPVQKLQKGLKHSILKPAGRFLQISVLSVFVFLLAMVPGKSFANRCAASISVSPSATQTRCLGVVANTLTATITVNGTSSAGNITYQWFSNTINSTSGGTLVQTTSTNTGTTTNTFTPPTSSAGTLWYYCTVTNTGPTCFTNFTTATVQVTVNALPAATTVSGAGTFCISTTITANNGSDGTMYFQGTTSNGTSTTSPSSSQLITTSGTYYFRALSAAGCWGTQGSATVTINNPAAPTGTASQIFCAIINPTVANLSATGTGIQWYAASSGGTALASSTALVSGTHYYASQTISGCEGTARLDVTATISDPAAPTGTAAQSFCAINNPTVANLTATGTGIKWYAAASGGTALATTTTLVDGAHYYASQTIAGCESINRFDVTVTVSNPAAPTGIASQTFCAIDNPTVANLTATGTGIQWYAASSGGTALATTTALVDGTHYYASQTISGCEGTARLDVTATVSNPAAPTGTASQSFCSNNNPTVADLAASGTGIQWYAVSSGGTALATTTALVNGTHYYASQTITGCEGTTRFDVVVSIYDPPVITSDPDPSQTVCNTFPVSFTVAATGDGLTYQWYKDGTPLSDNAFISGSNTATLTIDPTDEATDEGTYHVVVSGLAPCADAVSADAVLTVDQEIVITTQPVTPQTLCEGSTATFTVAATGSNLSYQWRKGPTNLVDGGNISGANTATLTISNITTADATAAGSRYHVIITDAAAIGSCNVANSNSATLIVNIKSSDPTSATASSTTICNGGSTTLTLNGGGGGTGEVIKWYTASCGGTLAGTGNNLIVSPTTTTTYYGRYEDPAPCSYNSNCASVTITVNQKSADPTSATASVITICNGQSTTLTLNGGGGGDAETINWYTNSCGGTLVGTGNNLSVSPIITTTYYGRYEDGAPCNYNSACASVTVTVNQKSANPTSATATSTTICNGGSTSLTLNGGGGGTGEVITWYSGSCGGTLVGTGNSLSVSPIATTTYYGRYEDGAPCNFNTTCASVTINVSQAPTVSNAGGDQSICGTSTTLTANTPTTGTGAWSVASSSGGTGGSFGSASSENSTFSITGFSAGSGQAIYTLVWTVSNNPCNPSKDTVVITFRKAPIANAGVDKSAGCGSSSVTLAGTAALTGQTGAWTIISGSGGTVTNPNSATSTFTSTAIDMTTYTLVWTVTNPPCTAATDTMTVTITPPITGNNLQFIAMCRDATTGAPLPVIGQSPLYTLHGGTGTYTYSWERSCNGSSSWGPIAGTGATIVVPQNSTNCFYRRTVVSGTCSNTSPGNGGDGHINVNNLPTKFDSINPTPTASYCNGGAGIQVGVTNTIAPSSGTDTYTTSYELFRDGVSTGLIVAGNGGTVYFTPNQTIGGTYTVKETINLTSGISNSCGATTTKNSLILTVDANVTAANAGSAQTVCANVTMAANTPLVGTGTWSLVSGAGTITSPTSPTTTVTGLATGANVFKWKITNGTCADSSNVTITAYQPNVAATALNTSMTPICNGSSVSLTQTGGVLGTGASWKWYSDAAYTTFVGNGIGATASITVSPTITTTYYLRAEGATAPCATITPALTSVTVVVNPRPTSVISGTQNLCNGSASITVTLTGTGPWNLTYFDGTTSTSVTGIASSPYTFTVSPGSTKTYTVTALSDAYCTSIASDRTGSATVTVLTGAAGLWTGAANNDWFNCNNWANGYVPTSVVDVTIPLVTNFANINAVSAQCKKITIDGGTLSFTSPGYLLAASDVNIINNGTLDMTTGGSVELQGNWSDQVNTAGKGFKNGTGLVNFSGSATQTISAVKGTELFYNLQINKTTTAGLVNLNNNITVDRNLTLTQGIFTTGNNLFTWSNSGGTLTAPEPSYTANSTNYTNSFIATCDNAGTPISVADATTPFGGTAGFQIKNVGNSPTYFPVGASYIPADNTYPVPAPNRMMINNQSGTSQDYTTVVNYGDIGYTNGTASTWRVNRIWYVKANPIIAGKATMQLFFTKRDWTGWGSNENEVEAGFNYTQTALVQKDYSGGYGSFINLSSGGDIQDFSGFGSYPDNTEIYGVYTINISNSLTNGIAQFNRFSVVNPGDIILPVSIINLNGYQKGNDIQIGWTALNELNVDRYEVEKSGNGFSFATAIKVPARNNGNAQNNYSILDTKPLQGNNFYRIKATDKNGAVYYTAIIAVNILGGKTSVIVMPNPVPNKIVNLQLNNLDAGKYNVVLYNSIGQKVFNRTIEHLGGSASQSLIFPSSIARGIYVLKVFNQTFDYNTKIVIE